MGIGSLWRLITGTRPISWSPHGRATAPAPLPAEARTSARDVVVPGAALSAGQRLRESLTQVLVRAVQDIALVVTAVPE